mmetsp:Transcript_17774/g.50365  ORF Transcript_17774/g.50365 Transcript_17774/m.50365 type:complete len:274 (-) Transcript_17774:225-1046(-)
MSVRWHPTATTTHVMRWIPFRAATTTANDNASMITAATATTTTIGGSHAVDTVDPVDTRHPRIRIRSMRSTWGCMRSMGMLQRRSRRRRPRTTATTNTTNTAVDVSWWWLVRMLLRLQGLVPHPGLLLGVVRFHLCLVALRVRGCQLGELGEAIGIDVLPPLSDDFSQLLERHLPALPRQPRQRRFVDVIVRRLVVVDLGPILRLHDLQDLLPLLLEEVVVAGAWPDGLVGRLLRSAVLLLSLGAFVFTVGCCIGVGIGVGVGVGGVFFLLWL